MSRLIAKKLLTPYSSSMIAHLLATLLVLFFFSTPAFAEIKIITAEATYIMGDGETPSFAEAMALQKAKQTALEEAGTYVQSYTKVQNLTLTTEEIQTIAGGVLQVEVLEKTRTLVGDAVRCYTKIKATVTTDKMEGLVRRIKGKDVAGEYTKLQAEYAMLSRELENWKQRAAKTPQGREREAALDQIREGEKAFARVQQREADLFQRLVSGKQLVEQAGSDKEVVDELLKTIVTSGYVVTVGDVKAVAVAGIPDQLALHVPLTIRLSETLHEAVSHAVSVLGGTMKSDVEVQMSTDSGRLQIGKKEGWFAQVTLVRIGKYLESANYFQDGIVRLALLLTFLNDANETSHCILSPRFEKLRWYMSIDNWFPLRRLFPIYEVHPPKYKASLFGSRLNTIDEIDNGLYDQRSWTGGGRGNRSQFSGYVAIVRDEATFVVQHTLPAQSARNLTGVRVRALSITARDELAPRCTIVQ